LKDNVYLAFQFDASAPHRKIHVTFVMPNFINLPSFTEDGDVHVFAETPAAAGGSSRMTRNWKHLFYRNLSSRVVLAGKRGRHFDVAARQTEVEGPY
jgi:hypothetical protein